MPYHPHASFKRIDDLNRRHVSQGEPVNQLHTLFSPAKIPVDKVERKLQTKSNQTVHTHPMAPNEPTCSVALPGTFDISTSTSRGNDGAQPAAGGGAAEKNPIWRELVGSPGSCLCVTHSAGEQ